LARFQLTRRIARSLGDSWASCLTQRSAITILSVAYNCHEYVMSLLKCCIHMSGEKQTKTTMHEKITIINLTRKNQTSIEGRTLIIFCHDHTKNKTSRPMQWITRCVREFLLPGIFFSSVYYAATIDGESAACLSLFSVCPSDMTCMHVWQRTPALFKLKKKLRNARNGIEN